MKWSQKQTNLITETISIVFVILFVYAAVSKFLDYEKFSIQVSQSPVLTSIGHWIVFLIPTLEIIIAILLALPRLRLLALYASYSLMVMFSTYIVLILKFSPFIPCACGGILDSMGWTAHLIFNLFFVAIATIGILLLTQKSVT
ncbi:MauE/DoxX family redox-associated membrane protein [Pseudotamlana agarivorans]|uniref:MauE/DoxX family redox-associated membrane protein n=1 Tax=Pseudotamlana agarivorans TaxID=481183 RepID=UPI00083409AE|nr:MauE/DoxX family redox-associated membrane protein [Tamlana agarivorans]